MWDVTLSPVEGGLRRGGFDKLSLTVSTELSLTARSNICAKGGFDNLSLTTSKENDALIWDVTLSPVEGGLRRSSA